MSLASDVIGGLAELGVGKYFYFGDDIRSWYVKPNLKSSCCSDAKIKDDRAHVQKMSRVLNRDGKL